MKYFLILCVLLFSACSTKRDMEFPSLYQSLHVKEKKISFDYEWWREYKDTTLNYLVAKALKENVSLKQGELNIKKSILSLDTNSLELMPSFSGALNSSVSRKIDKGKADFSYGGNLSLSYQLDIWGKIKKSYEAKEFVLKATQEELRALNLTIIDKIINTYFNLAYINDAQKLTEQNLQNYQKIYELTNAKYEHGKVDILEVQQAKESLLTAQNSLIQLKSQALSLKQELRDILNQKPYEKLNLSATSLQDIHALHVSLDIPFYALSLRPDLKAAELNLKAKFKEAQASEKSLYPTITLGASLSSKANEAKDIFRLNLLGGNVQINLPFLDYSRVKNSIQVSKLEYEISQLSFQESITKALNELDKLYKNHQLLQQNYDNYQERYRVQKEIMMYQKARYEFGKSSFDDFLNALNSQRNLEQSLIYQKYLILQSENKIFQALGGKIGA